MSNVLHWQIGNGNSNANIEKCYFKDVLIAKKYDQCNITLKTIHSAEAATKGVL